VWLLLFDCMRDYDFCGRFFPVAVFAVCWLSRKIRFGNVSGEHGGSSAHLAQRIKRGCAAFAYGAKRCICGRNDVEQGSRELRMHQRTYTDDLKGFLIA
jgi:hypothetical protein